MSNPFAIFRKNQNYWMAALVLVSILAFVVAPAIMQVQDSLRGGGAENAVVVRWDGGKMTVADLQNAMQKHGALVRFLSSLAREVLNAGGEPKVPGFRYDPQSKQILELGIQADSSEESICRTRILADKAARLGVQFTDQAVDDFIVSYCDKRVSTNRLAELLREAGDGRLSNFDVRELLKQELSAMVVLSTGTTGLYATVPGEAYQDFLKLNQTAKVEAFPVFVADHVDDVKGTPTENDIQAIYQLGSSQIADPNSPEPGFVEPYQANVEYVEVNLQAWVDREKAKLTEEQLRAEYDRRVELQQLKVPVNSPTSPADPAAETPAAETPAAETPADGAAPANAASSETPATPAEPEPAAQSEAPAATSATPEAPANSDQSSRGAGKTRFVAWQQEESNLPPPVVQPAPLDGATPAAETPAAGENAAGENAATTGGATEAATPPAESAGGETAMRTMTFEEAREQVATSLAQSTAFQSLDVPLTAIKQAMDEYYNAYRQYAAFRDAELQEGEEKIEEPRRPNIKKMAEDAGLTYGLTGKTDGYKLVQTQFGMSNIRDEGMGLSGSAAQVVMNPELPLFQPLQSSYIDQAAAAMGNLQFYQYLFWKIEEAPVKVPELADIRQKVVDYWKQTQARTLAENAATAIAKKVSGTGDEPWKDALSTAEQSLIIETDPFTWISRFGDFHMPSTVNKLDNVGGEFMQSVFGSGEGQVTVAPNQSRSVYYVVRVKEIGPDQADLQQRFNDDPDKRGPMSIAQEESNRLVRSWLDSLYNELGVQFEIPLNQL